MFNISREKLRKKLKINVTKRGNVLARLNTCRIEMLKTFSNLFAVNVSV